jgi:hypothetical protein
VDVAEVGVVGVARVTARMLIGSLLDLCKSPASDTGDVQKSATTDAQRGKSTTDTQHVVMLNWFKIYNRSSVTTIDSTISQSIISIS